MKIKVAITICIPCYPKHTKFLLRCVQSVENQTIHPEKIIIGHSEIDKTESLKLQKKFLKFSFPVKIIFTKEKSFAGYNRNRCVPYCNTKYISFFDSDDIMHTKRIEILWKNIVKFSPKCIIHSYSRKQNPIIKNNYKIIKRKEIFSWITKNDKFNNFDIKKKKITAGHITLENHYFNYIKYGNEKREEDYIFLKKFIKLYSKNNNDVIFIDIPLTYYTTSYFHLIYKVLKTKDTKLWKNMIYRKIITSLSVKKNSLLKRT